MLVEQKKKQEKYDAFGIEKKMEKNMFVEQGKTDVCVMGKMMLVKKLKKR